jgi:DNA ligase-1
LRPGDEVVAVPAIATEGIALFEAVVAQGVAGILARQRQSPYLPGVRSRLWRFIAATPVAGAAEVAGAEAQTEVPLEAPGPAAAPVLALISRLPLEDL